MKHLPQQLTYANVVASLALLFAMSGAAYAATTITGSNVKKGSITNSQVKDSSLSAADFSTAAKASLVGKRGDAGPRGQAGANGSSGLTGPAGDPGTAAQLTSTWAWNDTGLMTDSTADYANPNSPAQPWDSPTYGSANGSSLPNLRASSANAATNLNSGYQMVVALGGMPGGVPNQSIGGQGLLVMAFAGKITATATVSMLHRNDGESLADNGATAPGSLLNGRVQCKLSYGSGNNYASFTDMGAPMYASSAITHEMVNMSVSGNADTTSMLLPAGSYNIALMCRDADMTTTSGSRQWSFSSGNLTAIGSGA
ncbi:MAG: collagen-like protein [Thermoleophilia bacterium]|nr:collagen-like protein [Thermoleophilia bacterium]